MKKYLHDRGDMVVVMLHAKVHQQGVRYIVVVMLQAKVCQQVVRDMVFVRLHAKGCNAIGYMVMPCYTQGKERHDRLSCYTPGVTSPLSCYSPR